MAISSLWGWGVVRFVYQSTDITFPYAFGNLSFEHVKRRNITITNAIIDHSEGFRPLLDVQLINFSDSDADMLASLMGILSASSESGLPITIYHAYESGDAGSLLAYQYTLDSDISPQQIAENVSVGQTINLSFIGSSLVASLPTNTSGEPQRDRCYDSTDMTSIRLYDSTDNTAKRSIN